MDSRVLIVDDSAIDRIIISNILSDFELYTACDGIEAMDILHKQEIDLIILDINMPRMNGFEVLHSLSVEPDLSKIPTLILTSYDEIENEIKGLELGAVDYVRKPLNLNSLRKRIEVHTNIRKAQKIIESHNKILEEIVLERTKELILTRDITIHALIGLLEVRDIESSNHTIRTQHMMRSLSEHLSLKCQYKDILTKDYIDEIYKTSPLHDIGKVGIPDSILLKPGKLSVEEFEIMKKHVIYGVDALSHGFHVEELPSFINTAIEIVGSHHERFDGTGYPYGLKGTSIPLSGRLMAIVDVYDALTSKRIYKPAYQHEYALNILKEESGKHFDPELVSAFLDIEDEILSISNNFSQNK